MHHILLGLLLLVFALPIPGILLLKECQVPAGYRHYVTWLANKGLSGVTIPRQEVKLSFATWFDGSFQRSVTKWANENFAGRELMIRLFNQLLWSTCKKSYMYSEKIVYGNGNQLFEKCYLEHFSSSVPSMSEATIQGLAAGIAQLNDRLQTYRVPLVVLFTPSKAMTLPEAVPDRYRGEQAHARNYDRLKARLAGLKVPVLDGADLTRSLGDRLPLPPFPKTGIHWTGMAAFYTAEALLRKLEDLGTMPLARLTLAEAQVSGKPRATDADLLDLLNLAVPDYDRYAYARPLRSPATKARQGRLVLVGGSFVHTLNSIWEQAEVWERIDYYYYFTRDHFVLPAGSQSGPVDQSTIDWQKTFGEATAVVLEINEAGVDGPHLPVFLEAALHGLPPRPAPDHVAAQD